MLHSSKCHVLLLLPLLLMVLMLVPMLMLMMTTPCRSLHRSDGHVLMMRMMKRSR